MLEKFINLNAEFWNTNRKSPYPAGTRRKWHTFIVICYAVWPGIGLLTLPYTIPEYGIGYALLWLFISPWALLMYVATSALIASTRLKERTTSNASTSDGFEPGTKARLRYISLAFAITWLIAALVEAFTSFKIISETYWYGRAIGGFIVVAFGFLLVSIFVTERQISSKKKDK